MIYFDHAATSPMYPQAIRKMQEVCEQNWANPSSLHTAGLQAAQAVKQARTQVMEALGAHRIPGASIVFCGSGSEANNLALRGTVMAKKRSGKIIISEGEHACVRETVQALSLQGFEVVQISTRAGVLDLETLHRELDDRVILVSIMAVNNETGAVYDLQSAFSEVRHRCPGALTHTDAVQGFLKVPLKLRTCGADLVTISAHKIHGPKGMGALYIAPSVIQSKKIIPLIYGGGQENGLRSGTENVPGIAAFGEAAAIGCACQTKEIEQIQQVRQVLIEALLRAGAQVRTAETLSQDPDPERLMLNLPPDNACAPHIFNMTLPCIKSEVMLHQLSSYGIYVSSGSACSSHAKKTSPALAAFGLSPKAADCSIRLSFSAENTTQEALFFVEKLQQAIQTLVKMR